MHWSICQKSLFLLGNLKKYVLCDNSNIENLYESNHRSSIFPLSGNVSDAKEIFGENPHQEGRFYKILFQLFYIIWKTAPNIYLNGVITVDLFLDL